MPGIVTTPVLQLAGQAGSTHALAVIHAAVTALEGFCLNAEPETREHNNDRRQKWTDSQTSCGSISAFLHRINYDVIPSNN